MLGRFLPRSLRLRIKLFKRSAKLAIKVHLRETFGNTASTAVRRGLSMSIALYAICNFIISIFYNPYDSFGFSISLLLVAYGLGGTESDDYD